MPLIGSFSATFRWSKVELDGVVGERIERVSGNKTDEFGIQSFRGNPIVCEVVVARENLKDIDTVGSERTLGEMAKQFRGVVCGVCSSPLQFDERDVVCGVASDIYWDARYPVFSPPRELWL